MPIKETVLNQTKWADLYKNPDILDAMMEVELVIESIKMTEPISKFNEEEDYGEAHRH